MQQDPQNCQGRRLAREDERVWAKKKKKKERERESESWASCETKESDREAGAEC